MCKLHFPKSILAFFYLYYLRPLCNIKWRQRLYSSSPNSYIRITKIKNLLNSKYQQSHTIIQTTHCANHLLVNATGQSPLPDKKTNLPLKHHFSSSCVHLCLTFWRSGANVFVCVMYQCVISDRGSAHNFGRVCWPSICSETAHSVPLTDSDGGWWEAGLTLDPCVHGTVTHCPTLGESIDLLWMDSYSRHTHTHTKAFSSLWVSAGSEPVLHH